MATTIYLIRHGQSLGNIQQRFLGHTDWDLTELGHRQAACTAAVFADIPVDAVVSSDLLRAWHTALPIAAEKGLEIQPDPGFREILAGDWEGRKFEEIEALYPDSYACWRNDLGHAAAPGGETVVQLYDRVYAALRRVTEANASRTVVIATHATPIRVLMTGLSGLPIEAAAQIPWVSNASITRLTWEHGQYRIDYADRHDHLGALTTTLPVNV